MRKAPASIHFVALTFAVTCMGQESSEKAGLPALIQRISPSVVSLTVETEHSGTFQGTGVVVKPDGVVATNYHVVEGGRRITAETSDGVRLFCSGVLTLDEDRDLALLKFAAVDLPALKLGSPDKILRGEMVAVVGSPRGLDQSVSSGIVSAVRKDGEWEQVQITAPVSHGSSGSPVINMKGEIIGIATFTRIDGQSLNFASSVSHLIPLVAAVGKLEVSPLNVALPARRSAEEPHGGEESDGKTGAEAGSNTKGEGLKEFWDGYWASLPSNDARAWADFFTNSADYQYIKGKKATRQQIAEGSGELHEKYPRRIFTLRDPPEFVELDGTLNRVGLDFSFDYDYRGEDQAASGTAYVELALQWTSSGWRIYKFRERVERK